MSSSLFRRAVDEIAGHKDVALVPFFRGESLLHPDCLDMLEYLRDKGVGPVQFTTNATLMTHDIARVLMDAELDFISFSIDSIDPAVYGKIRKGAVLDNVLKNVEFFCDLKNKMGLDKPEIQVSVVKPKNTSDGIAAFVGFWKDRVDRIRVYDEHSQGGSFGSLHYEKGVSKRREPCLKPFTDMVVYWNGDAALCNHDWNRDIALGNVERSSIEKIWRGDAYKKIRAAHSGEGELGELCKTCDHWETFYRKRKMVGELYVRDPGNTKGE